MNRLLYHTLRIWAKMLSSFAVAGIIALISWYFVSTVANSHGSIAGALAVAFVALNCMVLWISYYRSFDVIDNKNKDETRVFGLVSCRTYETLKLYLIIMLILCSCIGGVAAAVIGFGHLRDVYGPFIAISVVGGVVLLLASLFIAYVYACDAVDAEYQQHQKILRSLQKDWNE